MASISLAGIDVSARSLSVCLEVDGKARALEYANNATGHRQLIRRLVKGDRYARVVVEASGIYSLDLMLALHKARGVEVMLANPRAVRDFARALLRRSKTDAIDAAVLLEFVRRMPFKPWVPPSTEAFQLRAISRRIRAHVRARRQEKSRLHVTQCSQALPSLIRQDIEVNLRHLDRRIQRMENAALKLVRSQPELQSGFQFLTSVKGIASTSAIRILAELAILPSNMSVRQWVAHAGLDPRAFDSGQTVHKPPRISRTGNKHLRAALFMPALVAIEHEPNVRAFYDHLIQKGKRPKQAVVAVMRKLLHSIYGMLKHQTNFRGDLFYDLSAKNA